MKPKQFFQQIDRNRIVAEIGKAERQTTGEIRVFISHQFHRDPVQAAQKQFRRLRMNRTRERNAVLIFVAPESRNFAVVGDEAIHKKCGAEFWTSVSQGIETAFHQGDFTGGLEEAVRRSGQLLAEHFPRRNPGPNQLPNTVAED